MIGIPIVVGGVLMVFTARYLAAPGSGAQEPRPRDQSPAVAGSSTSDPANADSISSVKFPSQPAGPHPTGPPWFQEATARTGIHFQHQSGASAEMPFPSANGSGLAALDYDLDGWTDLYLATGTEFPLDSTQEQHRNQLFRNLGSWRFTNVTDPCGLGYNGYSAGLAVGDYDNDGFPDVYVTCVGANQLFHNRGDGTFERAAGAGVGDTGWGTGAVLVDLDADGLLDLYVCNYAEWSLETGPWCGDEQTKIRRHCHPNTVEPQADVCYRSRGDGTFVDATASLGLAGRRGRGQGVVAADVNEDGLIDLYVANDANRNFLFLNKRDGRFVDIAEISGVAFDYLGRVQAGMGVDAGDFNGDGRLDLFVTNYAGEHNTLYTNLADDLEWDPGANQQPGQSANIVRARQFLDNSHQVGMAAPSLPWIGWGTAVSDFDLDGWLDVIVSNGHVYSGSDSEYGQPALLLRNHQGKRFELVDAQQAGDYFARQHIGRGLIVADLDNDGDQDVVIGHQDGCPAVLENTRLASPQVIVLSLVGVGGNRDAVGAQVSDTSGRCLTQIKGGGSYLSASEQRLYVVRPAATGDSVELTVRWPNRSETVLSGMLPGHFYVVFEPASDSMPAQVVSWNLKDE